MNEQVCAGVWCASSAKGETRSRWKLARALRAVYRHQGLYRITPENMTPDKLAEVLGRYLQAMAEIIQSEKGTIDKYIGDAVMTFWNAPEAVPDHEEIPGVPRRAASRLALEKLWLAGGATRSARFETRFGAHRCKASVGHFGAPDRLNYTAIGDGINLASRLEG